MTRSDPARSGRRGPFGLRHLSRCLLLVLAVAPALPAADSPGQADFDKALVALHDFEYEQALEGFQRAQQKDPSFALAYWGEAMTYSQVLWRHENVEEGRKALAKLGPTPAARAARAVNARDRGLLASAEVLFGSGDTAERHQRWADAMAALYTAHPGDPDVASFYALSLMGLMSRSLIGTSTSMDVSMPGLAGSDTQRTVADILTRVLATHPDHHGALHYLLHDYDDPDHASLALDAARRYAKVAGGASHALHMPAHAFVQLGLWHESASSNRASYDASNDWVRQKQLPLTLRNYHALQWLQYDLLQLGRYREAQALIGEIEPVVRASGAMDMSAQAGQHQPLLADLSSMKGRFVVETRRWAAVAGVTTFGNVNDLFAIGMAAARTGNSRVAEMVRQALAQRSVSPVEGDMRPAIGIMQQEIAALIELSAGRKAEAVTILQSAAQAENGLPPPLGLPAPLKPAPELLGEVLLEVGRPAEAVEPFQQTLNRHRNRSASVLGLARAAAAMGDATTARARYQDLLLNYDGADVDLPELAEAREGVAGRMPSAAVAAFTRGWFAAGGLLLVAIGIVLVVWRRKPHREPVSPPKARKPKR